MPDSPFPSDCAARYSARRLIGSGGYADVWLATQESLDRPVAVKLLHGNILSDSTQIDRFLNEARITAALSHPHIVIIHDHGCAAGIPWIAYEYVEGASVRSRLETGPLDWRTAFLLGVQVASALEAAHARGILHRDIKPDNLLQVGENRIKVSDFGLSRWRDIGVALTAPGTLVGSPAYLSPSQIQGEVPAPHTDLYALGVTLFEMVTGQPPFEDPNPLEVLSQALMRPAPKVSHLVEDIPVRVDEIIGRCLQKKPAQRYPDARSLREELEQMLTESPPLTRTQTFTRVLRPSSPVQATQVVDRAALVPPAARSRRLKGLGLAGVLALLVTGLARREPVVLPTPASPVPSPATDRRAPYHSQAWRVFSAELSVLEGGGEQARQAARRIRSKCKTFNVGNDPAHWAYWMRLGQWLDREDRPATPPKPRYRTVTPDYFELLLQRREFSDFEQRPIPARVDLALRYVVAFTKDAVSWLLLGSALAAEGRVACGRACTLYGLELLPPGLLEQTIPGVWYALIHAWCTLPGFDPEKEFVARLSDTNPDPDAWRALYNVLVRDSALFDRIAHRFANHPMHGTAVMGLLGANALRSGHTDEACRFWESGLRAHPTSEVLNRQLAEFHIQRGVLQNALAPISRLPQGHAFRLKLPYLQGKRTVSGEGDDGISHAFYLEERGKWAEALKVLDGIVRVPRFGWRELLGPVLELRSRGVTTHWIEQVHRDFSLDDSRRSSSDGPLLYAGLFLNPANQKGFEAWLNSYPGIQQNSLFPVIRAVWLSRSGRLVESLREMGRVNKQMRELGLLDAFWGGVQLEVGFRAAVAVKRGTAEAGLDAELQKREPLFAGLYYGVAWTTLRRGDYRATERVIRGIFHTWSPRAEWGLMAMWAAQLAGDTKLAADWRARLLVMMRDACLGLWLVKELGTAP